MSDWYPIMLNIVGRKCVVVGGGKVAERKIEGLFLAQADVHVISPELTPKLTEWAESGRVNWLEKNVEEGDLSGAYLVFASTDQPELNRSIAEKAAKRSILVNLADDGENGDFINPAVLHRGDLVLTASSSGAGPALAARIVKELAVRYGSEYNEIMKILREIRSIVKMEEPVPIERRKLLQAAVTDEALELWRKAASLPDKEIVLDKLRQLANERKG